ncbi:hypothetical protein IFM89_005292 [Coptis chinensis]|uniref:Major facilitator superfamily (MFS) profile domain-containing protein n=1 Tax=Coptis chinensis TaxID=261450 RepID=A0A835M913_9MAGN|nr:hypothetical protein IFM89_005292 [Coptis chinensis]
MKGVEVKMKSETLTLILVNLAGIMERADESLLPGVYKEVGAALHVGPTSLGSLTLFRSIVQTFCYPLAAYLAVHHNRAHVIALGAFLWAGATFFVGISSTFFQFTGNLGSILGGLMSVLIASTSFMGVPGWRISFHLVAILSVIIGVCVRLFANDPNFAEGGSKSGSQTPPLSFSAMWLELIGFSHKQTAFLMSMYTVANSLGGLFGGKMGDILSQRFPNSGRIVLSQISSGSAIPLAAVLMLVLPDDPSAGFLYGLVFFILGLFTSWNAPATNNPIFAEIVPEKSRTTMAIPMTICCFIYSFLYCTYPRDRKRAQMQALIESEMQQIEFDNPPAGEYSKFLFSKSDEPYGKENVIEIDYEEESDDKMLLSHQLTSSNIGENPISKGQ